MNKKTRKLGARFMWVHHHIHKQPTQDIHPSLTTITITTTTNNHCYYYYNHSQHHQHPANPAKSTTPSRSSLAPASSSRTRAWLRPVVGLLSASPPASLCSVSLRYLSLCSVAVLLSATPPASPRCRSCGATSAEQSDSSDSQ